MYSIVEFVEEKTVEMVPQSWIVTLDEDKYCYWPPSTTNIARRIKCSERPDVKLWSVHKVRVFASAADYDTARRWSRKAEANSSVDAEDEMECKRTIRRPKALCTSSEDDHPAKHHGWLKPGGNS
ncbi:hypothetical protein SKAU_G00245040 [Synaphobranchus kaupii]|uniref:Uncharacterized protein n=1 Tax=Synaphobranchus kaupii TaxID=118154 RepID=A0A9Q1F1Q5_SYNKA|nr:hypothetical protein SKAU_G00245040 [Synaphobranchus kaupii]